MNESRHTWMSHVTYECAMSHMNESCLIDFLYPSNHHSLSRPPEPLSAVSVYHTWQSAMSHVNKSCRILMRHVTYDCITSYMNESCPADSFDPSHIHSLPLPQYFPGPSLHGTCVKELWHIWRSHGTYQGITYEGVMSHGLRLPHTFYHTNKCIHDCCCNKVMWSPHTATNWSTLQHTGAHCKILQHTGAHCNTLQHTPISTATQWRWAHALEHTWEQLSPL